MKTNPNPLLLPCALLLSLNSCHAADSPNTAPTWKRFTVMVWQYKTPPQGPEAKKLYDGLNLHGVHLDNGFSDEQLKFARDNNYSYYVDHAAGKGDLYLKREEWDAFVKTYRQDRANPVRPRSIWDPALRERLGNRLRDNITRAKNGPVLAYAFDDEISLTSFTSPADVDWSPEGLQRFRGWLQKEYGTVEKLNAEWGSAFKSWDEVLPKGVDDVRAYQAQPFTRWNLAPWLDHRRFMNEEWAALLSDLTKQANALDPHTPAGFVGGQAPSTYGGYDYALLSDAVQWMEAYDIGGTNEILRSFWGQSKPHVQTYFLKENLAQDKWFLWYYLVHGNKGVIAWPDTDKGPWFANGGARDSVKNLAPTFAEVQGPISEIFDGATFQHDGIGLYYSQPSIAASWLMDITPHGRTWVNRSSSMNNENASDLLNRVAWTKLLEDSGLQYNFVSYRAVEQQGAAALKDYRVLILPRTLSLSDAETQAIRAWVEQGGTLIADYLPGVFDEHGKGRARGALDDVFGVQRDSAAGVLNGKTIAEVDAEKYNRPLAERLSYDGALRDGDGLVLYERGLRPAPDAKAAKTIEGVACDIERKFGNGSARYLNWTPLPYLLARNTPQGEIYRTRLKLPVSSRVQVTANGRALPLCERLFWDKGGKHYLCLVMNPTRAAKIDGAGSLSSEVTNGVLNIDLQFQDAIANLKNERTGRILGEAKTFTDGWTASEANIYSFEK
jgi:hypothetical protein